MLMDTAIPGDRNVIKNEAKKILKYKYLITEIPHMWKLRAKVIPVIIGVTETISKSIRATYYQESTELKKKKKQPYWALHTYY
jgi:hypothetical protein